MNLITTKVKFSSVKEHLFEEIAAGSMFIKNGALYMKIPQIWSDPTRGAAILLGRDQCESALFTPKTPVTPIRSMEVKILE